MGPADERAPEVEGAAPNQSGDREAPVQAGDLTFDTTTIAVWLAIVVALVGFLLLARLTVHVDGDDRTMRVADVWSTMAGELPDVSRQSVLKTIYYVSIAATLAGAFAAILIALAARDPQNAGHSEPGGQPTDGTAAHAAGHEG